MIRSAHVGVGISASKEGTEAVMASDYSISQFRMLQDLLLIHGGWNYRRISLLINYSFYKNIMLSMTQIWFAFYSGFSGTLFYDQISRSLYNLGFTGVPIILAAILNRPYSKEMAKLCPELYEAGAQNRSFNMKVLATYCLEGAVHSLIIFVTTVYCIDSHIIATNGQVVGFWVAATTIMTSLVLVAIGKVMLETTTWTHWSVVSFIGSLMFWFAFALIWSRISLSRESGNDDMFMVSYVAMSLPAFWVLIGLQLCTCLLPELLWKYCRKMYLPTRLDVIEEIESYPSKRKQFISEIHHYKERELMRAADQLQQDAVEAQGTHVGFSEFLEGKDHPDYIPKDTQGTNVAVTSTIPEESLGDSDCDII
eukprot:324799_1